MGGLSFVQQGFLIASLAAAVPILIHLLMRQKARRVDIGSLRFVRNVVREHNRMRKLRQWLLLAARVLAMLLLAFLFARPFLDRSAVEAGERAVVFLLDQSASMQLETSRGSSVFDAARDGLMSELNETHENTLIHIAAFDGQNIREVAPDDIGSLSSTSFGSTDFSRAIAWGRDILQRSGRVEKRVKLFTDLQQTGVRSAIPGEWPADIQLDIYDFGQSIASNLTIDHADAIATEIRPKMPPIIAVDIRNAGPVSVSALPVTLSGRGPDGKFRQTQHISLSGAERKRIVFEIENAVPGVYQGSVQLQRDDAIAFDNQRFVAFEARLPDRILIVDGEISESVFSSETYFLETALQLGKTRPTRDLPTFETERIVWENGEGFPDLTGFRAIVLANVGRFSPTDIERLRDYVDEGGSLLFFSGAQFTSRVSQPLSEAGILPAKIDGSTGIGSFRFATWEPDHPIFARFKDPQHGDLRRIRFRRIARLEPEASAQVLARSPANHPLLLEKSLGNGRVILLAATADRAWGDWPQHRLYVPFVRQMMAYLTGQHLHKQRILFEEAGKGQETTPGVRETDDGLVVHNVDPQEAQLARLTADDFRQALKLPEIARKNAITPEDLAGLAPPPGSQRANEIWYVFAWLLLLTLIVEMFLSGWIHA